MFIQTEDTPNPSCIKFIPGVAVLPSGTRTFESLSDAHDCPLAQNLLKIEGVESLFMTTDFVSVTQSEAAEWSYLRPMVIATLMDYLMTGFPVITEVSAPSTSTDTSTESDDPVVRQIKDLIETRVRPAVAQDGGDITFDRFENGVLYLKLQGACSGCPSSSATLKSGIENMLRYYVPEVLEVCAA